MNIKNKPLVTVVTATYNLINDGRKEYFHQCLQSVKNQTYKNIEHIVIDGASNDGTLNLIKKYHKKEWIKYISEPDTGIYDAMNKGIKIAKGEYIAFLNSDDYYCHDNVIAKSIQKINECDAGFSYGNCILMSKNKKVIMKGDVKKFLYAMPFGHPTMFARVNIIKEHSSFQEKYGLPADYALVIQLLFNDCKSVYIEDELVNFRTTGVSSREDYSDNIVDIYKDHYINFYKFKNSEEAKNIRYKKQIPKKFIKNFEKYIKNRSYKNVNMDEVIQEIKKLQQQEKKQRLANLKKHCKIYIKKTFN